MRKKAIYTRQSIDKKDSISIETQFQFCQYEALNEPYETYSDKGYSGKNTKRPDFERMFQDIQDGKISKVIVYKLDRISRSILDFSNMMDFFQKHDVEFVSSTEKFDTATPMGRAMLNICIVFAQLERETIQKRVTDAYYARCKKGFYMGGRVPYGYALERTEIEGIKTSKYVPVPEESEQIKLLYSLYANSENSLGDIVKYLNEHHIDQLRGGMWSTPRISDMLRNPVYVKADVDVYNFFQSQGANVMNPVTDFIGTNACYLYRGTTSTTRKQCDLTDKEIVIAPHEGIVSSREWLKCRMRCLNNKQLTKTFKPKNSWLIGKVKCGNCGYSLTIAKAKTKHGRYFICATKLATKGKRCQGTGQTIYADVLEDYIFNEIKKRLAEFQTLTDKEQIHTNPKLNEMKIHILKIDNEINNLLAKVGDANSILMKYINEKIEALDLERQRVQGEVLAFTCNVRENEMGAIFDHVSQWENTSFDVKQSVVDVFIKVIHIANEKIQIEWKL